MGNRIIMNLAAIPGIGPGRSPDSKANSANISINTPLLVRLESLVIKLIPAKKVASRRRPFLLASSSISLEFTAAQTSRQQCVNEIHGHQGKAEPCQCDSPTFQRPDSVDQPVPQIHGRYGADKNRC